VELKRRVHFCSAAGAGNSSHSFEKLGPRDDRGTSGVNDNEAISYVVVGKKGKSVRKEETT